MSDTPETDNFIVSAGYVRTDHQWRTFARKLERERDEARRGIRLMAQNAEVWKERADQARRELDIQLESIHFHMERKDEFICEKKDSSKTLAECIEEEARIVKAAYFDSSEELRKARAERDEARDTIADVLSALEATDCEGPRLAAMRVKDERNSIRDQRDFAMGEIERLRKETAQKDRLLAEMRAAIRWVADDSCKGWLP